MARRAIFSDRRLRGALAGVLVACAVLGCAGEQAVPQENDAPTFVSLNPCLDAILVEVAAPQQILALSHYSRDASASSIKPDVARQFGVTGGTVEEILALKPDVVLASTFMAPATRQALDRLGLRVEAFGSPSNSDESIAQVKALARLTGGEQRGSEMVRRIEQSGASVDAPQLTALMWQPGQIVPGAQTLVAEHIEAAGFMDYAADRGLEQADYLTLEQVLADPPSLLLVAGNSAGQTHPVLAKASKQMRVEQFDPSLLYCGGPTIPAARQHLRDIREDMESGAS